MTKLPEHSIVLCARFSSVVVNGWTKKNMIETFFQAVNDAGSGRVTTTDTEEGQAASPQLTNGISGESGGNPASIDFCYRVGLAHGNYSLYRVPASRFIDTQAAIRRLAAAMVKRK